MSFQIQNSAAGGASAIASAMRTSAPAPEAAQKSASAVQIPEAPKVQAPKPVAIQFDPAKAKQNLAAAVNLLNEQMVSTKRGLGFSFDEATNGPVIKVSNTNTGEVIRQIPTEDVLHMAHKIDDLKGILYNKVA